MNEAEFKRRTKQLGLDVIALLPSLPQDDASRAMGRQIIRCATSVGANYRAACRARSPADMIAKLAIVEEEADETVYWLEMLTDSGRLDRQIATRTADEANQIVAMIVASIRTLRSRTNPKSRI